jgi:tetratricopeptide (TPR) repeat protein
MVSTRVVVLMLGMAPWHLALRAEDRLELLPGKEGAASSVRGEITDISGGQVRVRRADGKEDVVPWTRVRKVHTKWPDQAAVGDQRMAEGKFEQAVEAYRAASAADTRVWVKREMAARACAAFRESSQVQKAGELFLSLYRADPMLSQFEVIPLAWMTVEPDNEIDKIASQWLAMEDSPAATLLGASWRIAVGKHQGVQEPLQRLTTHRDSRLALLAEAQLWRLRLATTAESDVESWERVVRKLPAALRAGPYFVVGQAWARLEQHDRAAMAWMRIPIEFSGQRGLAARSLELAAEQFDLAQMPEQANQLRKERSERFVTEVTP